MNEINLPNILASPFLCSLSFRAALFLKNCRVEFVQESMRIPASMLASFDLHILEQFYQMKGSNDKLLSDHYSIQLLYKLTDQNQAKDLFIHIYVIRFFFCF